MERLLGIPPAETERLRAALTAGGSPPLPGAVRASIGLGTTLADVERLVEALVEIAREGPRARYLYVPEHDEYRPADDPRAWPELPFALDREAVAAPRVRPPAAACAPARGRGGIAPPCGAGVASV